MILLYLYACVYFCCSNLYILHHCFIFQTPSNVKSIMLPELFNMLSGSAKFRCANDACVSVHVGNMYTYVCGMCSVDLYVFICIQSQKLRHSKEKHAAVLIETCYKRYKEVYMCVIMYISTRT